MQLMHARAPLGSCSRRAATAVIMSLAAGATTLTGRALEAQGPGLFDAYVSRKESTTNPLFGGIALGGYHGPFGIRVSGGLNFTSDEYTNTQQPSTYACGRYRCRNEYVQG